MNEKLKNKMTKINLPKDTLDKAALKSLPAKEKEEYVRNLLKEILQLNPGGITISQIRDATGLIYSTLWHHLEILSCTAQGNKLSHGNLDVYHPPGKVEHLNELEHGKAKYMLSKVENNEGKFVCIQEKRQNRLGNQTICKGISVPFDLLNDLTKTFDRAKKSLKKGK